MVKVIGRHKIKSILQFFLFVLLSITLILGLIWLFSAKNPTSEENLVESLPEKNSTNPVEVVLPEGIQGSDIVGINSNIVVRGSVTKTENSTIEILSGDKKVQLTVEDRTKFFEVKQGTKTATETKRTAVKTNQSILAYFNYDQLRNKTMLSRVVITAPENK